MCQDDHPKRSGCDFFFSEMNRQTPLDTLIFLMIRTRLFERIGLLQNIKTGPTDEVLGVDFPKSTDTIIL